MPNRKRFRCFKSYLANKIHNSVKMNSIFINLFNIENEN